MNIPNCMTPYKGAKGASVLAVEPEGHKLELK